MATQKEMLEQIMQGQVALAKRVSEIESGASAPAATPKASKAKASKAKAFTPVTVALGDDVSVQVYRKYEKPRVAILKGDKVQRTTHADVFAKVLNAPKAKREQIEQAMADAS